MPAKTHITDYLQHNALQTPDKLALITNDEQLTWAELWQRVESRANYLANQLGSDSQQVVALLMPNTWQYVVSYLAVVHAGHMAMPIDVIFKSLEIEAVLNQVPAKLIITDKAGSARIKNRSAPILRVEDLPTDPKNREAAYLRLPADQQIASLLFTSGTTGKPKVVPYTHTNHLWNIKACSQVWNWTSQDSQLISLRLSHMHGLVMGLSGTLYHGNTMYLQDRFNAKETLELLASGKVTIFTHGPLVYAKLLEEPDLQQYNLSGVRLFISGSAPLPPTTWQQFKDAFGAEILEVYGTTETGRIASNLLDERIPGSPGHVLPGVEVKFDEQGQVMVRSDGVLPGYLNNPEATNRERTAEGFWRTGDIGELVDGRLVLKGRLQERIRKQGYTVSPRDVEWALHEYPDIKEALVLGLQQGGGQDDKLVYFLSGAVAEEDVRAFCKTNLPSVWRADRIIILDKLPRTPNGKTDLKRLKAMVKHETN